VVFTHLDAFFPFLETALRLRAGNRQVPLTMLLLITIDLMVLAAQGKSLAGISLRL